MTNVSPKQSATQPILPNTEAMSALQLPERSAAIQSVLAPAAAWQCTGVMWQIVATPVAVDH